MSFLSIRKRKCHVAELQNSSQVAMTGMTLLERSPSMERKSRVVIVNESNIVSDKKGKTTKLKKNSNDPATGTTKQRAWSSFASFLRNPKRSEQKQQEKSSLIEISLRLRKNESLGVGLVQSSQGVCIGTIDAASQFANSPLSVGMRVVSINDQPCPSKVNEATEMIYQVSEGSLLKIQAARIKQKKRRSNSIRFKRSNSSDNLSVCTEATSPLPSILKKETKYTRSYFCGCEGMFTPLTNFCGTGAGAPSTTNCESDTFKETYCSGDDTETDTANNEQWVSYEDSAIRFASS